MLIAESVDPWVNVALNEAECVSRNTTLQSLPVSVALPTGTKCNLECAFCTDRGRGSSYNYGHLTFREFVQLVAPVKSACQAGLYGWGEPLLNPDYAEMFRYVRELNSDVQIVVTTNGTLLDGQWVDTFLIDGNCAVDVSLNSASEETYRSLTGTDHFKDITANVAKFVEARNRENRCRVSLALSFVTLRQNITELPAFIDLAVQLGVDSVLVQDLMILRQEHRRLSLARSIELARQMLLRAAEKARQYGLPIFLFSPTPYFPSCEDGTCLAPWKSLMVSSNGDVSVCCYSTKIMGNLFIEPLEMVWNGSCYVRYRETVNTDEPPLECRRCPRKRFISAETIPEYAAQVLDGAESGGPAPPRPPARPAPPRPPR